MVDSTSLEQFTDPLHPDYVPGTFNIYLEMGQDSQAYDEEAYAQSGDDSASNIFSNHMKKDKKSGIVLMPQPSDSPNDPLNWSYWRKAWHFALMAYITAFTAATSNMAGATQDALNEKYGISYNSMNTGAGVLFLSIGWGTLFCAPFANLYGRKLTYLICIVMGLCGAIWMGLSSRVRDTIWSQLFIGASEACAEAQVQLSLSDIFFQHQLGSVLTVYILATSVGTFLGPLIAGYISDLTTFRWVGYIALIISGGTLLVFVLGCEETYFDRTLYKTPMNTDPLEGQHLEGIAKYPSNSDNSHGADEKLQNKINVSTAIKKKKENDIDAQHPSDIQQILSQVYSNNIPEAEIGHDKISPLATATADGNGIPGLNLELIDGSLESPKTYLQRMALITKATNLRGWGFKQYFQYMYLNMRMFAFPAVWISGLFWGWQDVLLSFYLTIEEDNYYEDPWNYSDAAVAIMNVPTLIGAVLGCMYAGIVSDYFVLWMARKNKGILEAEYRLYFSIAVAILSPAGLFMFGIASGRGFTNWRTAYMGLAFIGFGWGCAGDIAMAYLMDCYPEMVLEGMVCTSLINNNLACIFTFTCSDWLDASGIENTFIALGVLTFFFTSLALPMFIYGKKARKWSKDRYLAFISIRDGF